MNQCIINVGIGKWYPQGTARLLASLQPYGSQFKCMTWVNKLPPESPTHAAHPYAFKPYAFQAAMNAGQRLILWCDSSVFAVKNPQPVFDAILRDGYYFRQNGFYCGQWMTDRSLEIMGISRDEAMTMLDFSGACIGIDTHNKASMQWFANWIQHATTGAFVGDWTNNRQQCSADPRCQGHRHDQVIGSVLFNQMGFHFNEDDLYQYPPQGWPNCTERLRPNIVFVNQGM